MLLYLHVKLDTEMQTVFREVDKKQFCTICLRLAALAGIRLLLYRAQTVKSLARVL